MLQNRTINLFAINSLIRVSKASKHLNDEYISAAFMNLGF